jgi:regulator of RNase E activity RraA
MTIQGVNVPVTVSGMAVCPNEIIHMDVNGAVKFPRKYLKAILENVKSIQKGDTARQEDMKKMTDPAEISAAMKNMYK